VYATRDTHTGYWPEKKDLDMHLSPGGVVVAERGTKLVEYIKQAAAIQPDGLSLRMLFPNGTLTDVTGAK
jgi:hypothetical protein